MGRPKLQTALAREIADLYTTSPALWAVVKGHSTPTAISAKLQWTEDRTTTALQRLEKQGLIHLWGGKYLPLYPRHKILRLRLQALAERRAEWKKNRGDE